MVDRQRSRWMRLITAVAIGALLAGCTSGGGSGNETGGTPAGGDAGGGGQGEEVEFVYLAHTDIDTLDVQDARAFTTGMLLGMHVFDTLVQLDAEEGFVPRLATSWEFADDGRVLRFHLRDDVKFHDGTPITAEHVARSFQRYLEQPDLAQARKIQPVHTIRAVDDYTVEFVADEPIGEFLLGNCL
ncbi:MAG TPA: ABC transporter substrate-binding protein, partial [Bacillota bacterium]